MGIRYSYDDFTTKGHGVIEYADPHYYEDDTQKPIQRTGKKSKYSSRWPSVSPIRRKSNTQINTKKVKTSNITPVEKQAWEIFKQRYPGQQPKKGEIKSIKQELLKINKQKNKDKIQKLKNKDLVKHHPKHENIIDKLTLQVFKRRHSGMQPQKDQLADIRQEIITSRKKLGL